MDSREIFRQYIMGAMKWSSAIAKLEELLTDVSTLSKMQEAARARYVIGFIRRVNQFKCGEASEKDLCLNIRDVTLVMGRVKLTEKLYNVISEYGSEFDLICENDLQASCVLHTPSWLEPKNYIKDVYAFKHNDDMELDVCSAGDAILSKHTNFDTYKSFEQKIAVHSALNLPQGDTLLISLPTGGGKSLVTQLLASTSSGLTVVIVPTVALALDQYHAALNTLKEAQGIFCYRGEQSDAERMEIIKALKNRKARILFTSPEAILKNQELRKVLDVNAEDRYLANVIVDEAHVVPDWGVFFRPDFQVFSIVLKKWKRTSENHVRTYLLSATLTVLSTEHGGNYSDLCRVTAVIGITDAYYDQFRDNFTDRVTHQISVTDQSYGADNFLIQMTGHYLNAIYCNPDQLRQWNESGADIGALPISQFKTPCKWETTTIEGKEVMLIDFVGLIAYRFKSENIC